ncbi:hypothetical protein Y032_0766g2178 [Ancylostoma ceylanicum]|uniref:Uncharacterized protein n=1 Tax=Ancylostoma ceylanicum TaxID=53326 RepID=A0A016WDT0_9BILA|nr:hypothetical protein Y032_0766g2178 [Ancylostoma ceylanicum]
MHFSFFGSVRSLKVGVVWREVQEADGGKTARVRAAAMAHFPGGCSKRNYKGAHTVSERRDRRVIQVNLLTFAITAAGYVRRQESVESDETGFNCK